MHKGSRAFCLLMAFAAAGVECAAAEVAPNPHDYTVQAALINVPATAAQDVSSTVFNASYSDAVIARLVNTPRTTAYFMPKVRAADTKSIQVGNWQAHVLSDGKAREVGPRLDITPDAANSDHYILKFENVSFAGYNDTKASQPVFNTQRISTSLTVFKAPAAADGWYCVNLPASSSSAKTYDAHGRVQASVADANERQLLFVKITRG